MQGLGNVWGIGFVMGGVGKERKLNSFPMCPVTPKETSKVFKTFEVWAVRSILLRRDTQVTVTCLE